MSNLKDFYKNKRVFITGHTGFKGTWLTACLLKFGSKIMGYSKPDDRLKIYKSMCHHNKVKNAYADILDYKFLRSNSKSGKRYSTLPLLLDLLRFWLLFR